MLYLFLYDSEGGGREVAQGEPAHGNMAILMEKTGFTRGRDIFMYFSRDSNLWD